MLITRVEVILVNLCHRLRSGGGALTNEVTDNKSDKNWWDYMRLLSKNKISLLAQIFGCKYNQRLYTFLKINVYSSSTTYSIFLYTLLNSLALEDVLLIRLRYQ